LNHTLIFIPTYNESGNIAPLFAEIQSVSPNFDVLFLDDNSPDGTGTLLDALAAKNSKVKVIHRTGKLGIGSAHLTGIRWAYEHGYQTLITMDADLTHSPTDIPKLLERAPHFDIVVGSRYMQIRGLEGWNILRKTLTWTAHILTTVLLDLKYDSTGAFRLYRLDRIPVRFFDLVHSCSYSFFFESLHLLNFNKFSITEVPISLPPRTYGSSKMNVRDALKSVGLLARTFLRTIFYRQTLKFNAGGTK